VASAKAAIAIGIALGARMILQAARIEHLLNTRAFCNRSCIG
jgi:nitrate/TMAO reductase-like tetraheme cytochrome c subunit